MEAERIKSHRLCLFRAISPNAPLQAVTSGSSFIPDTLRLGAYQPNATARKVVQLLPGFSTVDANGQSRPFSTAIVGGTTAPNGESVVITTRSDYELGASGNLLLLHTVDNFGRDEREYHHEFGFVDNLGNRTLFVRDMLGSTRAVLKNGTMVEWNDYYAYGAVRDGKSLVSGRWLYLGKELDSETATLHLDAREYDPFVGFMQLDPLMHTPELAGYSPYHYSFNNPYKFKDPTGKNPILLGALVGASVEIFSQVATQVITARLTNQPLEVRINLEQVGVAAVAGGLSGGLSLIKNAGTTVKVLKEVTEVLLDAGESTAKQLIDPANNKKDVSGSVDLQKLMIDVGAGFVGRKFIGEGIGKKVHAEKEGEMLTGQKEMLRIDLKTGQRGVEKTQGQINKEAAELGETAGGNASAIAGKNATGFLATPLQIINDTQKKRNK